ncbi:hypothetical protein RJ640_001472, partial [Escallonia rubra]
FVCGGASSQSSSVHMDDIDDIATFTDIPDSFVDIPSNCYPLIITFHKLLLMLDGTVGISFFRRFPQVRQMRQGRPNSSRSVGLENFIRTKEVNYERFRSSYWPHFNSVVTKQLDSSVVYTEIISVIKGGLHGVEAQDKRMVQQDYVSLSEDRKFALSIDKREMIYNIFLQYEKRKMENCEFDLADLVIDLHRRLKDKSYEGEEMDFVYIDEVQDLAMGQISLFKYICRNVDEGFVFCGDTAQTIAKGIDFRFEDIRRLFYEEFVLRSRIGLTHRRKDKGLISDIFHLSQNFRTHAGVLKLASSVINLLYYFFPFAVDVLSPETSLLYGEAPILLKTLDNKSAVTSLFENSSNAGGHAVGFGAEQVILVRDECVKKQICNYVGKKALVLTIVECKGLEFQDVLLYDFFSSSPCKNYWRVVYEYMNENDLLDSPTTFTCFSPERHNVLCSKLKQLYVAITRTKQRLWICENEVFPQPMLDYWKKLCLVEERHLDDTFAKEIQVVSNKEEWKSRGIKLFHENHYEMAKMCFERAGDTYWERLAEASRLRTAANSIHASNLETSCNLRNAAAIFYSIGKFESAAQCYFEIHDYKRAGTTYIENFQGSKLEMAGKCFMLAKCYLRAAEVYARARLYAKSISACIDGELFDIGLQYIQDWDQNEDLRAHKEVQMGGVVLDFLQRGAIHYYELKANGGMMKFVRRFPSRDMMRIFLKEINCLDELLSLEREWGNFLEAANIAKLKGDRLLEADLLEMAGFFKEASMLILWHVFSSALRPLLTNVRALNQFMQMEELLTKAKLIAESHSGNFNVFVCTAVDVLLKGKNNGELLGMGLEFIQHWKQNAPEGLDRVNTRHELEKIEQELLERSAQRYHDLKDNTTMMKLVKSFHSRDLMRKFFRNLKCFNELIILECEWGNFLEAANTANMKGDFLLEADYLEKAGFVGKASLLRLWLVFLNSLQSIRGKCEPLNKFRKMDELLTKAQLIAKSLSNHFYNFVCTESALLSEGNTCGEVLEMRLQFIRQWKQSAPKYFLGRVTICELDSIEQDLLERCALHYFHMGDKQTLMKHVTAFWSIDLKRGFLKTLSCLDELLLLEEEQGNFLEAAYISEQKGDLLHQSDLLEKAGQFEKASKLKLWYVLAQSLWLPDSKGWPLKQFPQKEEILEKATACAKNKSDTFFTTICTEAEVLSGRRSSLSEMRQDLRVSQGHGNLRGEILTVWKILDAHFSMVTSKYEWNDVLIDNPIEHSGDVVSRNCVSVESLVHFWNCWKEKIVILMDYLLCITTQDDSVYMKYKEFCLNYFGVQKQTHNQETIYVVLNSEANWVREIDSNLLRRKGELICIDYCHFVSAAMSYWHSEILSSGIRVLETLKDLHVYSTKSGYTLFHQSICLLHMFEIAKFLQNYKFPNCRHTNNRTVQNCLELAAQNFFKNVFHIDWQKSLTKNMVSLRGSNISMDLLEEAISRNILLKDSLTYGQIGRALMMILGSGKKPLDLYNKIISIDENPLWTTFIEKLSWKRGSGFAHATASTDLNIYKDDKLLVFNFYEVLKDTFYANWRTQHDYITPACFLYLAEQLLVLVSYFQGYFFTTRSSVVEWIIYKERGIESNFRSVDDMESSSVLGDIYSFMASVVQELLLNKHDTMEWIEISNDNSDDHHRVLVLRLVVLLCLICVNSGKHFDKLTDLLDRSEISSELPSTFCAAIRRKERYFMNALADALQQIQNPLVIVSLRSTFLECSCPDAVFLNMKVNVSSKNIIKELFIERRDASPSCKDNKEKYSEFAFENQNKISYSHQNSGLLWKLFDAFMSFLSSKDGSLESFMSTAPILKVVLHFTTRILGCERYEYD